MAQKQQEISIEKKLDKRQQVLLVNLLQTGVSRTDLISVLNSGTDDEWQNIMLSTAGTASNNSNMAGREVVLSGGAGTRRKWNGCSARITKYPKNGSWMTVRVFADGRRNDAVTGSSPLNSDGNTVKWRKGSFCRRIGSPLLDILPKDLLIRILSFLGDEYEDTHNYDAQPNMISLKEAGRIHTQVASVCQYLRKVCEKNLNQVLPPINANMDGLRIKHIIPCILWLCKYKIRLGNFRIGSACRWDIPLLCWLLRECNTSELFSIEVKIDTCNGRVPISEIISTAWYEKFQQSCFSNNYKGTDVFDLTGSTSTYNPDLSRKAWDLGVPFEVHSHRKDLHDTIAIKCPNVVSVSINLLNPTMSNSLWIQTQFSQLLFSMGNIQKLKISFGNHQKIGEYESCHQFFPKPNEVLDSYFLMKCIKNLSGLVDLEIGFSVADIKFLINSKTLRFINVENMGKSIWISCTCPRLEKFVCNGSAYGNGTRPNWDDHEYELNSNSTGDVMYQGTTPMVGMDVPDSCKFVLRDFHPCQYHYDALRNAPLYDNNLDFNND